MFVLKVWIFSFHGSFAEKCFGSPDFIFFCGSLAQNDGFRGNLARHVSFRNLDFHFWWRSRRKRSIGNCHTYEQLDGPAKG